MKELEKPLKACKRFALGADKSVPLKVLDWETGIPKMEDILENTRDRASLRLNKVATDHPTVWRKAKAARMYKLRNYVTEDVEAPWSRKAKHSPVRVRRLEEDQFEKSFLRQTPGSRWIFVSVKEQEAHYQVRDQRSTIVAKGTVRAGPHNTNTDAGLRAMHLAYRAKGEVRNG